MEEINKINMEELAKISGGSFPDGEYPDENTYFCPRCGARPDKLELIKECVLEIPGSKVHELVTDNTYRAYRCSECGVEFWRYAFFYEFIK